MAGRTSEKGNTTGKTIFCFIGKVIGAGITAFAILALFCVFYYNPPVHEPCGNGVTSYVRQADTFWARGTEGFAMGTTDNNGYNNSYPSEGRKTAILMMGSSQTEGLYVNEDDCVSYLLNEKYDEDGSSRYVYNVGMSAHTIYRNISNLENALKVYQPAEYVALETGTLAMNPVEAAQALNHEMPELTAGSGIPALEVLEKNPYIKLLYQQYKNLQSQNNGEADVTITENAGYDVFGDDTYAATEELLSYISRTAEEADVQAVIYYIPDMTLTEDGSYECAASVDTRDTFAELCGKYNIIFADMTDSVEEAYVKEHIVASGFDNTTVGYGHLNAYGHELLAQCIYDAIGEEEQR